MSSTPLPAPAAALFALLRGEPVANAPWDDVGVYALALGLGPVLLVEAGDRLPASLQARLKLARRRTETRTSAMLAALTEVLQAAAAIDLPILVLKGAYLAPALYGDLGLRGMSDVDVLVHPHDLTRLRSLLLDLGYEGKYTDPATGPGIVKHDWTFKQPDSGWASLNPYLAHSPSFHLEPHVSLCESWFGLEVDLTPGAWERSHPWDLNGAPACVLCPVDVALHTSVHAMFHLIMGKSAYVQLVDLHRLLTTGPGLDFEDLLQRAQEASAVAHLLASLRLASAAYATPVPRTWLNRLETVCPPRQRPQVAAFDHGAHVVLEPASAATTLSQRLRRGLQDRALAASWSRDRGRPCEFGAAYCTSIAAIPPP